MRDIRLAWQPWEIACVRAKHPYVIEIGAAMTEAMKRYGDNFLLQSLCHEVLHCVLDKMGYIEAAFMLDNLYRIYMKRDDDGWGANIHDGLFGIPKQVARK